VRRRNEREREDDPQHRAPHPAGHGGARREGADVAGRTAARGCFVVNAATELGTDDPAADERAQAAFGVTRGPPEGCRTGELRADLDVDAAADTLFTLVLALRVRARAERTMVIDAAFGALR
jgi:hypothetical protein